jgi:hypothetical protein
LTSIYGLAAAVILFPLLAQSQIPIPHQADALPVPIYIGQEFTPQNIPASTIPDHPFLASNGWSNTHNDLYMSEIYFTGGPLGAAPMEVISSNLGTEADPIAVCITVAFDSQGRIVTTSLGRAEVRLYLIDPHTLNPLAKYDLPSRSGGGSPIAGGAYFFLDNEDRVIVPTGRQIQLISHDDSAFHLDKRYELEHVIPEDDAIGSTLPDFAGRLWFVTKGGLVGTIDRNRYPDNQSIRVTQLEGEKNDNSFAIDENGGVFIVTDHALYRFDAGLNGEPTITWREVYDRGHQIKPGQFSMGSGTTPTLMGSRYVALTDNAEPQMHVLVYHRAKEVDGARLVCSTPVFQPDRSATENSLIATDRSIIVENNYGYSNYAATTEGQTTEPGMTRIDPDDNDGCRIVWTNQEHIPSVISKMSLATGLIYTYTKDEGPENTDAWYFTAIDYISGKTVFKQLAGTGVGYNNHYAGIYLGPDGKTAYVGVLYGIVAIRDRAESESGIPGWMELDRAHTGR